MGAAAVTVTPAPASALRGHGDMSASEYPATNNLPLSR